VGLTIDGRLEFFAQAGKRLLHIVDQLHIGVGHRR
jgi:hypothetical protein